MANALVFLSDLHTGRSSFSVQVRLFRFWEARSVRRGGDHMGVDMLLLDSQLSVVIDVPGEEAYHLQPRLILKIIVSPFVYLIHAVPEKCKYEVMSTKIEKRLAKEEIITWASLKHGKGPTSLDIWNFGANVSMRLAYPSSMRVKDWDKLEDEVKKHEKNEKPEGDTALNKFFRKIYSNADEDMRREMSKSFVKVESNGTVFSIDRKEVGTKKIESTPPDGM
ncbi:hypothetical protein HID58_022683 [Brassica napus]|uniref:SGS domain-containing protein n=2 Tax=Brassica TaxID=3705 RepID=A0ABQ8CZZ2_BRANA|nr:hypothetical protein HID58_022683 [Brassica napus]